MKDESWKLEGEEPFENRLSIIPKKKKETLFGID